MVTDAGDADAITRAEPAKENTDSRPCLGGGGCFSVNPRMAKAKVYEQEQQSRREKLEMWKASRPPTQKKTAGYVSDWASSSVSSRASALSSALSSVGPRVNSWHGPRPAESSCAPKQKHQTKTTANATALNMPKAGIGPRASDGATTMSLAGSSMSRPASASQQTRTQKSALARAARPLGPAITKAKSAGATPPVRLAKSRSYAMRSSVNLEGVSDQDGLLDLATDHSLCSAPPPSPCTPYARRLPAPSLDRHVLAEVLQETFDGLAAAWNAPKRLEVFIGTSPGRNWQDAGSPEMSNKENIGPGGYSMRKKLMVGSSEDEVETTVGDEVSEEPSPFCCSASPASGPESPAFCRSGSVPPVPEDLLTRDWMAKSRNKRPSLSDWYTDVPDASELQ